MEVEFSLGILGKQAEKWFLDYINPVSCIPFPLPRGRGERFERGASAPLKRPLFYSEESQRETEPLLPKVFPLSQGRAG